jgi:hypothetical protein
MRKRRSKSELTIPKRALAMASLQGTMRATNRWGGVGGKARTTGVRERSLSITITQNQNSTVREMRDENFVSTVGRRGRRSMGRRLRGESAMQTRNANLVIADLVGSTRHLWTTTKAA